MSRSYDIAIVGAGPAGMSAATLAAEAGASVVVLDDKPRGGGQIYRKVGDSPLPEPNKLGPEYLRGRNLLAAYENGSAEKLHGASVWHVGDNGEILFSRDGGTLSLTAREILLNVGAMERPFPIPGWQLPGVMTAGSAQVMLKNDGLVRDDAVFAGTGPLLYLIVAQYLRLGVRVRALVDTTPFANYRASMSELGGALADPGMLLKGVGLLHEIRKAGVPVHRFARDLRVRGDESVTGLQCRVGGQQIEIESDHVFLHQGVIPNLNLTRAIGLEHDWCPRQLCWKPRLDELGQSSVPGISVAGDASGIVGAEGAELTGRIAALNQLARLGLIELAERDRRAAPLQHKLRRLNRFRRFIDRLYRPLDEQRLPAADDTMVCRCEEQTLAQLRAGFEQGACGPNELKSLTRCGMGPCQGRQCGHTVSELLADWRGEPVEAVGYYRLRSPMRLLNLTEFSRFERVVPGGQS